MAKQVIRYISGPPGIGKTTRAAKWVVKRVLKKKGPTIYVAPTIALLTQFFEDVSKEWVRKGLDKGELIRLVSSCFQQPGRVRSTSTVDRMLGDFYEGRESDLSTVRAYSDDALIFMTHEGFFTIKPDTIPKKLMKKTAVFFDEAKKTVFDRSRLSLVLGKNQAKIFRSNFKVTPYEGTNYFRIKLAKKFDMRSIESVLKSVKNKNKVRAIQELVSDISNCRNEVYVSSETFDKDGRFYGVTLPSRMFHGFGRVTLMSAYFEASQMYHLLKSSKNVELKDITDLADPGGTRRKAVSERYKKTTILPLTVRDKMLTLHHMRSTLITEKALLGLKKYVREERLGRDTLKKALTTFELGWGIAADAPSAVANIVGYLTKVKAERNPIEWYLRLTDRVIKQWDKKQGIPKTNPLMFVNKRYASVIDANKYQLLSTSSYGLNQYQKTHVAVFLAAINPEIQMVNFMRARVGEGYDYQKDYAVDVCLQCISRTSVRDTKSDKDVLIIVPDMRLARFVQESMFGLPRLALKASEVHGRVEALGVHTARRTTETKTTASDYYREYNKDPINKELNTLRQRLFRFRKMAKAGEDKALDIEETLDRIEQLKKLKES